jgi:sugar/nucleoside kinase (ribokinase family)
MNSGRSGKLKRLLGIGNALVDILIPIDDERLLDELGLIKSGMTLVEHKKIKHILHKTSHLKHFKSCGGSSANTVSGLARLGMQTGFIGSIGDDEFGRFFRSDLVANHIDAHLFEVQSETGKSISLISPDTERTMATFLGAANELFSCEIGQELFKKYHYLLAEAYLIPYREFLEKVFKLAQNAGIEIVMDLSSFSTVEQHRDYLGYIVPKYVDIVLANEDEARTFTYKENPQEALQEMARHCKIGVVKCGEKGSFIQDGSRQYRIDPISIQAIDATGAGDLYAAGFLYGLMNGYPVDTAGKMGACVGGKVVEVIGAKMHDNKWSEVRGLIQSCVPV